MATAAYLNEWRPLRFNGKGMYDDEDEEPVDRLTRGNQFVLMAQDSALFAEDAKTPQKKQQREDRIEKLLKTWETRKI